MDKNTVEARQWLDKCYPDSALLRKMLEKWFADFKRGRTNTDDSERSGRPNSAGVPKNIKKSHKLILGDCKLKLHEIANTLKILEGSVFTILHEHFSMRKLYIDDSASKISASVFWDAHGILFIDYLAKGRTSNSEYSVALLARL